MRALIDLSHVDCVVGCELWSVSVQHFSMYHGWPFVASRPMNVSLTPSCACFFFVPLRDYLIFFLCFCVPRLRDCFSFYFFSSTYFPNSVPSRFFRLPLLARLQVPRAPDVADVAQCFIISGSPHSLTNQHNNLALLVADIFHTSNNTPHRMKHALPPKSQSKRNNSPRPPQSILQIQPDYMLTSM